MASPVAETSASVGLTITGSEVIDSVRVRGVMEVAILFDVLFVSILTKVWEKLVGVIVMSTGTG
jgi:hypothetical protein